MNSLIIAARFAEDLRYFEYLRGQPFARRASDRVIDEVVDLTLDRDFRNTSLRVTKDIAPRLYATLEAVKRSLGVLANVDLYIRRGGEINAFCARESESHYVIGINGGLVEKMNYKQIEFVIGHELGHAVYEHHQLPVHRIVSETDQASPEDIENLMRWSRMAEISADRAGLMACDDINACVGAMLVLTTGISTDLLEANTDEYISHCRNIIDEMLATEDLESLYSTHPFNPLRVVALREFWGAWSKRANDDTFSPSDIKVADDSVRQVLEKMEGDVSLSSRVPEPDSSYEPKKLSLDSAVSQGLFWFSVYVASADGEFSEVEVATISNWIFEADVAVELNRLLVIDNVKDYAFQQLQPCSINLLKEPDATRCSILQKLVVVARADGVICDDERTALSEAADLLQVSRSFSDKILKYL